MTAGGALKARVRECWVLADDMRLSCVNPAWPGQPILRAVVLETVVVHPSRWRQGLCKGLIRSLVDDPRFELVVVEGVQNEHLWEALARWGWACDPRVQDFYWPKSDHARAACARLAGLLVRKEN